MYQVLLTTLLVLSVIIVAVIFMQPAKNQSSNVFDAAGSGALFERTKARGFEAVMQRFSSEYGPFAGPEPAAWPASSSSHWPWLSFQVVKTVGWDLFLALFYSKGKDEKRY